MKIEKGIPIPSKRNEIISTLRAMTHGDSVVVPIKKSNSWRATASVNGMKIASHKISDSEVRIWKIEKPAPNILQPRHT